MIGEVFLFSSLIDPARIFGCCCYGFEATSISTYCSAPLSGAYGPTLSYIILSYRAGDGVAVADRRCQRTTRSACWTDWSWSRRCCLRFRCRYHLLHRHRRHHIRCHSMSLGWSLARASSRPWYRMPQDWKDLCHHRFPLEPGRQSPEAAPPVELPVGGEGYSLLVIALGCEFTVKA